MRHSRALLSVSAVLVTTVALTGARASLAEGAAKMTDEQLIASATKAAPPAVAKDAAVIDLNADGTARTVRAGKNGYTCLADNPVTPGPDPMCADANAMEWVNAWVNHLQPPKGKLGIAYMLEGGTDASNTDPYATAPAPNNHWVKTPPHIMVVGTATMMQAYPRSADPDTTKPYVMWADTPYEHLMVPVH